MKIKSPQISVLMPNYNCDKYISEAIESILNQSYSNFEFIIIDDCSSDNSWQIIQEYAKKDKRIRAYRNNKNLGIVKTRNKLLKLVSFNSKYIAIMDSDDISLIKRLEIQVNFLENNTQFVGVGTALEYFWEKPKKNIKRYYLNDFKEIKKKSLIKSPFAQATMLIQKKVLDEFKGYDEKYEVSEDWELWLRIIKKYKMTNLNQVLYRYRQFEKQSKNQKLKLTLKNSIKIRFKYMKIKDYFNLRLLFRIFAEISLLILPNKFILWIFYKTNLKK